MLKGVPSSGVKYTWSHSWTPIRNSPESAYSKSVREDIDFQLTTTRSERSRFDQTSSSAMTTAKPRASSSYSRNSFEVTEGMNMKTVKTAITTKSSVHSYLPNTYSDLPNVVNSFTGSLSGSILNQERVSSQSTSPVLSCTVVTYTSVRNKFSNTIYLSTSMAQEMPYTSPGTTQISHTSNTSGFGYGTAWSLRTQLETSQSALNTLPSYSASKSDNQEQSSKHSGSLNEGFSSAMITPSSSSYIFTMSQGSSAVHEILTTTKATSPTATRQSYASKVGPRNVTSVISQSKGNSCTPTLPLYTRHGGLSTGRDVTSLQTTMSLSNHLQTRKDISQSQSGIKATSFGSTVPLNTNFNTGSPSSGLSPDEVNSQPITSVSSHTSVSPRSSFENLLTVASKETSTNGISSWIPLQKSMSYRSSSTSKQTLASRKMSSQKGNVRLSIITTSSAQHLKSARESVKESPLTPYISTTKLPKTYQQTLHKGISRDTPAKSTVTSITMTAFVPSRQYTAGVLSQDLVNFSRSSSTDKVAPKRPSSQVKADGLSIVSSSGQHRTLGNPHETSQHLKVYSATTDTPEISTQFPITPAVSSTTRFLSTVEPALKRTSSEVDNVVFSNITSSVNVKDPMRSINVSMSRVNVQSVSTTGLHKTFQYTLGKGSSDAPTTVTRITITTVPSTIQPTALSRYQSSASRITTPASRNISLNASTMTHSLHASTKGTVRIFSTPTYTSTTQVKLSKTTDSYMFSSVLTTSRPSLNSTTQFKIMDGSFVIKNRNFHANLSNPNSTMFKVLAVEVEEIIMDVISLEAKVTSFRNGSIIADFYLKVSYDSQFSDRDYARMLSEANETLWRGYYVTNITVTLRANTGRTAARLQDNGGLSKGTVVAIFAVFSVLLIAVGGVAVYVCTKKGLCERSRVKPADSPIPPSELEKIQPVRRGTWVENDEPFLKLTSLKIPTTEVPRFTKC
ncbi:hypothetical protein OS493_011199 [Desmophyllum pertusum]|uniref:SEA domain-containing protein n=1 Tax=Desmophyllum pertusum TaxID=174260 RepID=A0A9W9Z3C8_9CNID|nr:hypothetical protein OS493_011199 [Desmophyllum pertusum]